MLTSPISVLCHFYIFIPKKGKMYEFKYMPDKINNKN